MSEEKLNRKNEVPENNELSSSTPVVMVSNDCCSSVAGEKPQINDKPVQKTDNENIVMNLQKAMGKAFEAQKLLEVTMEQLSKQMQEIEMQKQNISKGIEQSSAVQDGQDSSISSESETQSEDVVQFHGNHNHHHHHHNMMMPRHGAECWVIRGKSPHGHYGKHQHKHGECFMRKKRAQWSKGHKHGYPMHKNVKCRPLHKHCNAAC